MVETGLEYYITDGWILTHDDNINFEPDITDEEFRIINKPFRAKIENKKNLSNKSTLKMAESPQEVQDVLASFHNKIKEYDDGGMTFGSCQYFTVKGTIEYGLANNLTPQQLALEFGHELSFFGKDDEISFNIDKEFSAVENMLKWSSRSGGTLWSDLSMIADFNFYYHIKSFIPDDEFQPDTDFDSWEGIDNHIYWKSKFTNHEMGLLCYIFIYYDLIEKEELYKLSWCT